MEISLSAILFQIINFSIIFWILKKFMFGPITKMLDERATKIEEGLTAAEKNLKIQEELEQEKILTQRRAKRRAETIIKEAEKQAQVIKAQAREDAKAEAKKIITKEQEALESRLRQQQNQFKRQAAEVVRHAAEAILKDSLQDVTLQRKVIDSQINQLTSKYLN